MALLASHVEDAVCDEFQAQIQDICSSNALFMPTLHALQPGHVVVRTNDGREWQVKIETEVAPDGSFDYHIGRKDPE